MKYVVKHGINNRSMWHLNEGRIIIGYLRAEEFSRWGISMSISKDSLLRRIRGERFPYWIISTNRNIFSSKESFDEDVYVAKHSLIGGLVAKHSVVRMTATRRNIIPFEDRNDYLVIEYLHEGRMFFMEDMYVSNDSYRRYLCDERLSC
jgi:hypothetical protein